MGFSIDPARAAYDFDRGAVNFYAEDSGTPVRCAISEEALMDNFGSDGIEASALIATFRAHAFMIGAIAERKYRAGAVESDGRVLIRSSDR